MRFLVGGSLRQVAVAAPTPAPESRHVDGTVDAQHLYDALDELLNSRVGRVGGLILRKKWRDLLPRGRKTLSEDEVLVLLSGLGASLDIILEPGDSSAVMREARGRMDELFVRGE